MPLERADIFVAADASTLSADDNASALSRVDEWTPPLSLSSSISLPLGCFSGLILRERRGEN